MICPLVARTCAGSQCMAWHAMHVTEISNADPHGPQNWGCCGMVGLAPRAAIPDPALAPPGGKPATTQETP